MFTKNVKVRKRGRPPGRTAQGEAMRGLLYREALRLFARNGYEGATLREIAKSAGVSVGLLYKYFPSKEAVVLELYRDLSVKYVGRMQEMPRGPWTKRYLFALRESLGVLAPHREILAALAPLLVSNKGQGVLAPESEFSRVQIEAAFAEAVRGAQDAPRKEEDALALGRVLYVSHLGVILWWLLDGSAKQRATGGLLSTLEKLLPAAGLAFRLGKTKAAVGTVAALCTEALYRPGKERA